ncbi:MAG: hypothetical protein HC849_15030 [Oscillatoriales cyanobacterium RU_3_3]|nr:hypothetical protein [Microcoleus sp. SU_5_6]NJL67496.1 hypothetical protein [Microcoleus sp. SM1_3_4]NJM61217.1 hypothetical protein [Oscillatoriales cyanobacterium RU_3_3]NJR22721.1 hypothetical protein [Richelia sp. CSU_2_1]
MPPLTDSTTALYKNLPPEVDCPHRRNQRSKSAIERPKTDRFCAQLVEPARKCYE